MFKTIDFLAKVGMAAIGLMFLADGVTIFYGIVRKDLD